MTITNFSNGERHVSGNRCERGASLERVPKKSPIPNMYEWKYKRVFGYRRLTEKAATRGDIGIPRVLNMYEDYPFWFTVLTHLKFRVMISGRSNHDLFEDGMESIPSENVCYPAKLVHGHIESLLDKGITTIFYPCVSFNEPTAQGQDNTFNCPIVATYPEVIRNNMERLVEENARFISPFLNLNNRELLPRRLAEVFADWDVTEEEAREACEAGWEISAFHAEIKDKARESLDYVRENGIRGIVIAGFTIGSKSTTVFKANSGPDGRANRTRWLKQSGRPLRVRDRGHTIRAFAGNRNYGDDGPVFGAASSFGCSLVRLRRPGSKVEGARTFTSLN